MVITIKCDYCGKPNEEGLAYCPGCGTSLASTQAINTKDLFTLLVTAFPHPNAVRQISAPQPRLLTLLLCLVVPSWAPRFLSQALMQWPAMVRLSSSHPTTYALLFVCLAIALLTSAALYLGVRYSSALWAPRPKLDRRMLLACCLLLPLFLFDFSTCVPPIHSLVAALGLPDRTQSKEALAALYHLNWDPLAFGGSPIGVLSSSVAYLLTPPYEEIIFSGLLANATARSLGPWPCLFVTPACFALAHAVQFGLGPHLFSFFLSGLAFTALRLWSGSLLSAVLGHLFLNVLVLTPRWIIAAFYFSLTS